MHVANLGAQGKKQKQEKMLLNIEHSLSHQVSLPHLRCQFTR